MRQILLLLCLLFFPVFASAEDIYVSVRETQLRPKADFLSKGAYLKYGDRLSVLQNGDSWINVKTIFNKQGYVHRSAVTERRVVLNGSSSFVPSSASQSDVVLAGKGFSKDVENQFAAQNAALNFREVDAMERPRVAPNDLVSFIEQGKLNGGSK